MSAGHIRQRGRNSWELKYDGVRDPITGKRNVKFKTVHGSKRDAQSELRKAIEAVENGMHADAGKLTLASWLKSWLESRRHLIGARVAGTQRVDVVVLVQRG